MFFFSLMLKESVAENKEGCFGEGRERTMGHDSGEVFRWVLSLVFLAKEKIVTKNEKLF